MSNSPSSSSPSDVKTLYISGLPYDVKEREIYLLCRQYRGFEFCNLRFSDLPSAFVKFTDRDSAAEALKDLNGFQYDLQHPELLLRAEFARSDTQKKQHIPDEYDAHDGKRRRITNPSKTYYHSSDPYYYRYGQQQNYDYYYPSSSGGGGGGGGGGGAGASSNYSPPPSNTLFVGNLSYNCQESDLTSLFRQQHGFKTIRLTTLKNRTVAFVQFTDTSSASNALHQLAGTKLHGNVLRIEFAQESRNQNTLFS